MSDNFFVGCDAGCRNVASYPSGEEGKEGDNCWNNLGQCHGTCDRQKNERPKLDPSCGMGKFCCIPQMIVVATSNDNDNETESSTPEPDEEENPACALGFGFCRIKCEPPYTVYVASNRECPIRQFCCLPKNFKLNAKKQAS